MSAINTTADVNLSTSMSSFDFIDFLKDDSERSCLNSSQTNHIHNSNNKGPVAMNWDMSFLSNITPLNAGVTRQVSNERRIIDDISEKTDAFLPANLEPSPIAGNIQNVAVGNVGFSKDLLQNWNDYCFALEPLRSNEKEESKSFHITSSVVQHKMYVTPPTTSTIHLYDYQLERWMDRYSQLAAFYQQYGHSDISNDFDSNLAGWVRRQRHQFKRAKQGRRSTLTVKRVALLEDVGFKWDFHDLAWQQNFQQLKNFYSLHNHCNVTTTSNFYGSKEENDKLLNWCKRQKRAIRLFLMNKDAVGSRMNLKRLELLNSIGFRWEPVKKSPSTVSL
jgi:hypothetical protein